jgi:phosphatidylserine/phosphatidylglycerophosphate/cardiolipin synthase-like enzyme
MRSHLGRSPELSRKLEVSLRGAAKAFIGSENFSSTSLSDNRELGLIISDHAVLSAIARTFAADFRSGKHWS